MIRLLLGLIAYCIDRVKLFILIYSLAYMTPRTLHDSSLP